MRNRHYLLSVLMVFSMVSAGLAQFQYPLLWERVLGGIKDNGAGAQLSSGFAGSDLALAIETDNCFGLLICS